MPRPRRRTVIAVVLAGVMGTVAVALYPLRAIVAYVAHPVLRALGRRGTLSPGEWGGTEITLDRSALGRR